MAPRCPFPSGTETFSGSLDCEAMQASARLPNQNRSQCPSWALEPAVSGEGARTTVLASSKVVYRCSNCQLCPGSAATSLATPVATRCVTVATSFPFLPASCAATDATSRSCRSASPAQLATLLPSLSRCSGSYLIHYLQASA